MVSEPGAALGTVKAACVAPSTYKLHFYRVSLYFPHNSLNLPISAILCTTMSLPERNYSEWILRVDLYCVADRLTGNNVKALVLYYLDKVEKDLEDAHRRICQEALTSGHAVDLAELARWRLEDGVVASVNSVPNMLADENGRLYEYPGLISLDLKILIWKYAALSVADFPLRSAHWGFWAKNTTEAIADVIFLAKSALTRFTWMTVPN